MDSSVENYMVLTADGQRLGHVVEARNGYLIIEHGILFKTQRAVPRMLTTVDDEAEIVRLDVTKEMVEDSPHPDRDLDHDLIDSYYAACAAHALDVRSLGSAGEASADGRTHHPAGV